MAPPAKDVEFTVHGVTYIRSGSCSRCGSCCGTKSCPHFIPGATATCSIFSQRSKRNFSCNECMSNTESWWYHPDISGVTGQLVTHKLCGIFPNHPFLHVTESGICSYTFTPKTAEDVIKHQALVTAWH